MATVGVSDVNALVGANELSVPVHNKILQVVVVVVVLMGEGRASLPTS